MKNKIKYLLFIVLVGAIGIGYFQYNNNFTVAKISKFDNLRGKHEEYLSKSPFKESLQLTKQERKNRGLPPNKYYEREWELTLNPATGKPEPHKVYLAQKERSKIARRAPGDGDVTNNWIDRGPNNVGGRTRVLLFDPNDSDFNRVFAGGVSGGLWVNEDITNENSSWNLVEGVPGNMNISCITVDPNNSQIWYIGTGEQYASAAPVGNGVYKSVDGGTNWSHLTVQLAGGGTSGNDIAGIFYINDIVAWSNPNGGGIGIPETEIFMGIGTNDYSESSNPVDYLGPQNAGLYHSTDDGGNWTRIESTDLQLSASSSEFLIPNDFEISANNTLWMGSITTPNTSTGGGKVFSSTDGVTWNLVTTLANSRRVELAVSSTDENKIYALTEGSTSAGPHIYVTEDAFTTAVVELGKPIDADISYGTYVGIPANDFARGVAYYNLVIEVEPTDDTVVYVGGINMFRTTEGENTIATDWKQISKWSNNSDMALLNCSLVHADQHALTFNPGDSNSAVIGNDGGIYYTTSLSTSETNDVISARNNDYNVTQFYSGSYGQDVSNELLLGGTQDNGSQFIEGASEGVNNGFAVFGGDGGYNVIDKDGDYMITSFVYAYYVYYKLPYTGNNEYYIDQEDSEGDFINPAGLDHNLDILFANGNNKINRYVLGVSSSSKIQLSNGLLNSSPTAFKVSPFTTTSTTLLVGTQNSKLLKLTNANDADVSNIVWEDISGPSFVGSVSDIEFGDTEDDIYVTFHNYGVTSIWYSADGGTTWDAKEGDLPDFPVKCILQNPNDVNEVIIGTEIGVWSTANFNDVSPTWVSSYNGMQDVKVVDLDLRTADNSILAATHGRGFFTGKFSDKEFTFSTDDEMITYCGSGDAVFNLNFNTYPDFDTKTNFTSSGEPTGVTVTFDPTSLENAGAFTMTLGNLGALAIGEYPITIIGTAGSETNNIDVVLKVVNPSAITTVNTTSPVNGATAAEISGLSFDWDTIDEATSYDIEIATDAGFNTIIETSTTELNSYSNAEILNSGVVYYWRVRALNDCVTGDFSKVKSFQTSHYCDIYSNEITLKIPDGTGAGAPGDPAYSEIDIPTNFTISDVNVWVNISHTYINDLVISIIAPSGTEIILFNRDCDAENDLQVTYDDSGSTTIVCAQPISGVYQPTNPLSVLNAENVSGTWKLKVVDYYNGDRGEINNWSIEACKNETVTNSTLVNNPIIVGTNSSYAIQQTDIEASSIGSTDSEQVFMLNQLPVKGAVNLNSTALLIGETFTQDDINNGKVTYSNTSSVNTTDSFKVDITNATGGYVPNQEVLITIDSSLSLEEDVFSKAGVSIFPTISNGEFSIASIKNIGKVNVEIYAVSGQRVFVSELNLNNGTKEQIYANDLASGVYILKLTSEELTGSKKIIIR